ncbi:S22A7 protein, partial [Atractosteus spatula]|nr:S22A7 protein [Atractosteus spatula]
MRFEELLKEVGAFSRFQGMVVLLLCIPRIILPLHFLLHNFISAVPPHHCANPPLENGSALAEATEARTLAHSIPQKPDGSPSSCSAFPSPVGNLSNRSSAVPCQHGWVYDPSQFHSTTATQWDLVCDNKKLNQALATFFFVGVTLGAVIFGFLSDKFGRKPMLLVSFVASAVFGIIGAFSVSYVMFAVTRTLCGISLTGMSIISIALSVEWTDVEHRTFTGTINGLSWTVGNMLLALLAYFIRDWRQLTLAATSPCLVAIVAWWWIPESARWLLANGKVEQAHKYLSQCAKMNGKESSSSMMNTEALSKVMIAEDTNTTYSYLDLVKTPKMKRITLCCGIVWFGVAFTYYGISFKITGFGVNMYLTHFIYAAVEVPAKVGTYFVLDTIGRRNGQAWSLIITGILIGINTAIPTDVEWVDVKHRLLVSLLGGFSWPLGTMWLAGTAYFINEWRWLTGVVICPLFLAMLTWFWVPESARWLIANGKMKQAHRYLSRGAKMNNRPEFSSKFTLEMLSSAVVVEPTKKNYSYLDLVRTPRMRRLALLTGPVWFGIALTYYGISLNITGFGLNIYLTQAIYGAIEIPAKLLTFYCLHKIGRRQSQAWSLILTGVCIAITIALPNHLQILRTVIAIIGKGLGEAAFTIILLYTAELYPTVVRQNGFGYNSFLARLGVSIAPLIMMLEDVWKFLPQVIFCTVAIASGTVAWLLPETLNAHLPETIDDVEQRRTVIGISAQEKGNIPLRSACGNTNEDEA